MNEYDEQIIRIHTKRADTMNEELRSEVTVRRQDECNKYEAKLRTEDEYMFANVYECCFTRD